MRSGATLDALLREAARRGRRVALVDGDRRASLKRFDQEVTSLAASLTRLRMGAGTRVALLMPASIDALACFFAVLRAGGAAVPVSPLTPGAQLGPIFDAAKVSAVLTVAAAGDPAHEALTTALYGGPRAPRVIAVPAGELLSSALSSQAATCPYVPARGSAAEGVAAVFCTTGTTGQPRAVVHTHRGLVASVRALHAVQHSYFRGSGLEIVVRLFRLARLYRGRLRHAVGRQTWLTPMPFHSIAGIRFMVQAILTGQRLVIMARFHPRAVVEVVETERVNVLALSPTMLEAVLAVRTLPGADLSSLIAVGLGSAPATADLIRRGAEALGCPVLNGYGSTETAGGVLATRVGEDGSGGVGYPFPGTEIVVADDAGQPVPPGTVGELRCRTGSLMAGYSSSERGLDGSGAHAGSSPAADGWFCTGDLAMIDGNGAVHIVGRSRDLIIRGGVKIAPATIEQVLLLNRAVRAAAVVGVPDAITGERIVAFVVAQSDELAGPAEILAGCRGHLSPHEMPDHVFLVADLPRAESGEVRKVELRALASRRLAEARAKEAKEAAAG